MTSALKDSLWFGTTLCFIASLVTIILFAA